MDLQPVKYLSACTIQLYLYSPYVSYRIYRYSVPDSTSFILLLPWAIQALQSLNARKVQLQLYSRYGTYGLYRAYIPVEYSYTSTPSIGHTVYRASVALENTYTCTPPMSRMACTDF